MKNPSNFMIFPCNSVFQKCEHETIALNIIKILARTGDNFRKLSWKEYKKERTSGGENKDFSEGEKRFFIEVVDYCTSANKAKSFSPDWRK